MSTSIEVPHGMFLRPRSYEMFADLTDEPVVYDEQGTGEIHMWFDAELDEATIGAILARVTTASNAEDVARTELVAATESVAAIAPPAAGATQAVRITALEDQVAALSVAVAAMSTYVIDGRTGAL